MIKKLLIILYISMVAFSANAYDFIYYYNGKPLYFNKTSASTCEIAYGGDFYTGGYSGDVVIPSTVNGYEVTSIGHAAFWKCGYLTSVQIPSTVTSIGNEAFSDCSRLTTIEIPNSVTALGDYVFNNCVKLKAFYGNFASADNRCLIQNSVLKAFAPDGLSSYCIPDSITSIGKGAFWGSSLTSVLIPNSVTSIDDFAFYGCSSLTTIDLPSSITSISHGGFKSCIGLTAIEIPNSVTAIGEFAFQYCTSLTTVEIPNTVTDIGVCAFHSCSSLTTIDLPSSITSISYGVFGGCSGLTAIEIPNSVTAIGEYVFHNCINLSAIDIPNSITSIGSEAFYNCKRLKSIKVLNENPSNISMSIDVFPDVPTSTCILYVPKGSKSLYAAADQWKDFLNIEEFEYSGTEEIIIDTTADDTYYDLMGRKVANPHNGILIHNGKKVYIK